MSNEKKEVVISEDHENVLRTVLKIDDKKKTPAAALELYSDLRTSRRRAGHAMSTEAIALIPVLLNRVATPEPHTFADEIREASEEVKWGTRVVAKFAGTWQIGKFVRMTDCKVVVILDSDGTVERKINLNLVRLATREDIKKLGE